MEKNEMVREGGRQGGREGEREGEEVAFSLSTSSVLVNQGNGFLNLDRKSKGQLSTVYPPTMNNWNLFSF